MPFSDGWAMVSYARDAEDEDRLYLRWAVMYQGHISFEEFKARLSSGSRDGLEDGRSGDEILEIVREIIG